VRRAPPAAPAQPQGNWSGGQFGGFGGGSQMSQSFVEPGSNLCPGPGAVPTGVSANYAECPETHFEFSSRQFVATGGFFLGYRWQNGVFVYGVEADIAFKNAAKSGELSYVSTVDVPGGGNGHQRTELFSGRHAQKTDASLRLRFGQLITPLTLAYATGGIALGEICGSFGYQADIVGTVTAAASGFSSWCDTRVGYTVGAGVETQVARRWKARLEYRYTDFGTSHHDTPLAVTALTGAACDVGGFRCNGNARVDLDSAFHTFRVGLGLDF
jgi:outer membrane immunogenic protein